MRLLLLSELFCTALATFAPVDKQELRTAVDEWTDSPSLAESKYGHISKWDTSMVADMSALFQYAVDFDLPIGSWNTSNATNMSHMFDGASRFNQYIGDWNTSSVADMSHMFRYSAKFDRDIGNWDTQRVTNMSHMFYSAMIFNQDIGKWNTGRVTDMSHMFHSSSVFSQDIGKWDTKSVTDMSSMFAQTARFSCNISGWNVCSAQDMSDMFCRAKAFSDRARRLLPWEMKPAACGMSTRSLTPEDVNSCLEPSSYTYGSDIEFGVSSRPSNVGSAKVSVFLSSAALCILAACFMIAPAAWWYARKFVDCNPAFVPLMQNQYNVEREGEDGDGALVPFAGEQIDVLEGMLYGCGSDTSSSSQTNSMVRRRQLIMTQKLERGNFGSTWMGRLPAVDGVGAVDVAAKSVQQAGLSDADVYKLYLRMVHLSVGPGGTAHPHLVRLRAYAPERPVIVMELCTCNLKQYCCTNEPCISAQLQLLEQVAAGCAYIVHRSGVHGNLKMENVLIAETRDVEGCLLRVAKVADFGITPFVAIEPGPFSVKGDVYCFGLVMLGTFSPSMVATGREEADQVAAGILPEWKKVDPWVSDTVCREAASWVCKCVAQNEAKRPSFEPLGDVLANLKQRVQLERCRFLEQQ